MSRTNWAGNLTYGAERYVAPKSVAEVQQVVRSARKVRAVGARHCFNDIADTTGTQLSLGNLKGIVSLDESRRQVVIEGGARYSDICASLHQRGYALHNLASLPHITVAGACATATHGSGTSHGNLATAVAAVEFINAEGDLVTLSREDDPDVFPGVPVNLGALGVITKLTLDLHPASAMRQDVYCDLPVDTLAANFDAIMGSGYSVSLFTRWQTDLIEQAWVKNKAEPTFATQESFFGAKPATRKMHPIVDCDPLNSTEQMGTVGPFYDRLPHFRIDGVPAGGDDYQAEYFLPIEQAPAAVRALRAWGHHLSPLLMVSEVRTVAADDLWLSPCYGRAVVAFHFSFRPDESGIRKLLPGLEAVLAPFAPVPHWGKLFTMEPGIVRSRCARLGAFRDLVQEHDPAGKFRNAFVERMIFG